MDIITLALAKKQIGKDTTKAVSDYLDEHLTNPTNPPLDTSLTIANAAADSKATGDKLSELKEGLNVVENRFTTGELVKSENLFDVSKMDESCYYWTDGRHSSTSYNSTDYIAVSEGMNIHLQTGNSDYAAGRANRIMNFIIAYDSSKNTLTNECKRSVSSFTVPSRVSYIRISAPASILVASGKPVVIDNDGTVRDYIPYFDPYYTLSVLKEEYNNTDYINQLIDAKIDESGGEAVRHLTNGFVYEFAMNSDDHIFNADTDLVQDMFNYSIQFKADVTTFSGIIVAHGYNSYMGGYVRVTPTNFEYYMGSESNPRLSEAHNLTIKDYIAVRIDAKPNFTADFTVYTNGGVYTKKNQSWDARKGYLSVRNIDTNVLTNCALSYMCKGWSEPIHLYGNSYFGVYSDKWTQYLVNAGWSKYNLNGYPGRASAEALKVCKNVLSHSNPEKIVWCLGMNDGDDGEVDTVWKACVDELKQICTDRKIELILATIPNVATVDNSAKNAYVEASGLRYIDFATAVGAHDGTTWYDGMLSSDGVHPAVQGAIALFNEAIATVPELMQ